MKIIKAALALALSSASLSTLTLAQEDAPQGVDVSNINKYLNTAPAAINEEDDHRFVVKYKAGRRGLKGRRKANELGKIVMALEKDNVEVMILDSDEKVHALEEDDSVAYVERDHKHFLTQTTQNSNDTYFPYGIGMVRALEVDSSNVSNRKLCIVDTGYDLGHEDLQTNKVSGYGGSFTAGPWDQDGNGHGTHVAGTIAGIGNNNKGVIGVVPNSEMDLFIVRVFGNNGSWASSRTVAMLRRVLGVGSTGLLASQLAVHAMPLDPSWSRSRVALSQSAQLDQRPVVVCGPSGVGKGTLLTRLMAEHPDSFGFSVSHTTRQPRAGEVDGVHYHFVKKEDMEAAITRGEFIEYARVHSNMYGTSIKAVEDVRAAGKTCLLDIDVQGAELVRKTNLNAVFVFVAPPSYEELERRLRGRGTENEETLKTRLANAQGELAYMYKPGFFDCVIINDDVDKAYDQLKALCVPAK